jgi:transcriptional regulator with XRE-family HTH domain
MANKYKPLGQQLREHRVSLNLSQEAVAAKAGMGERMIRLIESGATETPRTNTVGRIAKALGCIVVIYSAERIVVEALPQ